MTLTGEHIRTARQLLGWSQLALALRAGVGINQLRNFESEVTAPRSATIAALQRCLEAANIQFIAKNGGGAGVRLR
jgi:transcriptional regulator with XRE-family HTH domain